MGVSKEHDSMGLKELGTGGRDRAKEKTEESRRPHSGNYDKKNTTEVPDVSTTLLVSVRMGW